MSISTNIHRLYVGDPLCSYISLVNNYIGPKTPYFQPQLIIHIKI